MTTANTTLQKPAIWFWILAIVFLLWNIMGIMSFLMHALITDETIAQMPANEQALYGEYPLWTSIIFAIAVISGLLGSIGLLLRKKCSRIVFIISLGAIIIQMSHNVFFTQTIEVYGIIQAVTMPILVVVVGIFLIWFSSFAIKKKILK